METAPAVKRVALVGNCIPRRCGIATFTHDLCRSLITADEQTDFFIVPVNDVAGGYDYPRDVWFEIDEKQIESYRQAGDFLNLHDVDVVCLQHEFGIFGGPAGRHVLALLRGLNMPVVATLHTILREPTDDQLTVMAGLIELTDRLVTLSQHGADLLREVYGVPERQIAVIPHGIPDLSFVDPSFHKDKFGVAGRRVLLTFGLIGPGKGIEQTIDAMPEIIERHPDALYMVVGATHPNVLRHEGEVYRVFLQQRARKLGVADSVIFHNRFVSDTELGEFIGAADIYVTSYLNEAQACSGTLARAVGAGKAVVSTPYWHASELLADGRGVLVPFDDPRGLAEAVCGLLDDDVVCSAIRKRAYLHGRAMVWNAVATDYIELFDHCLRSPRRKPPGDGRRPSGETHPVINLAHIERLTDGTGLLQHCVHAVPNYSEGYTTDDNARALILMLMLNELMDAAAVGRLVTPASRYMAFLQHAFDSHSGRFRNSLAYDHRRWLEDVGSEDSQGRALWALGTTVARGRRQATREWALCLFDAALPAVESFTSPRAWAFTMIGITEYLHRVPGNHLAGCLLHEFADRLLSLHRKAADDDWDWFEASLTYCNAKLPHALIVAGACLHDESTCDVGLRTLDWLCHVQTGEDGTFRPIGSNGFHERGGARAEYDQQPIEAHATLSAAIAAQRVTGDSRWLIEARRAFDWFLGGNDLGRPIYDPGTGGCHDGIHPGRINANQGAESTLAFLLSQAEIRLSDPGPLLSDLPTDATAPAVRT